MDDRRQQKVVVVGGGLAGLAATGLLSQSEDFKVDLLEASSLFGGRVRSAYLPCGNVSLPLGATFFHGEKGNSLLDFAIQRGIVKRENGRDRDLGDGKTLHILSDGTRLPESAIISCEETFKEILEEVDEAVDLGKLTVSRSLCDYVCEQFVERTTAEMTPPQCSTQSILEHFLYNEGVMEGSKRLEDVDVLRYGDYKWLEGAEDLFFDGNPMQRAVDTLVSELPSESLHLNCEVESIVWNQKEATHPITVHCTNGDQYSADHVIITVSLGVLKKKCNSSFFSPPLPVDKQEAIASLGFGAVNQVILHFPEPPLEESCDAVCVYYKDRNFAEEFPWTREIYRFDVMSGRNTLSVWFAGDDATTVEQLSESELAGSICKVLETLLQKAIPPPTMVVSSNWHSDPLFCGSYSYPALGTTKQHRSTLAAPLEGRTPLQLLFAGEATHPTLFSTANAAYDTGLREAQRLIDLHTKTN